MGFKINQKAVDDLYAGIAQKIERVDKELRAEWTGKPAAEIEPVARGAFAAIGVPFSNMNAYAEAVEKSLPFQFNLQ